MSTITLPGPLFLTALANHGKSEPRSWRELAGEISACIGREISGKEDLTRLIWLYLLDRSKEQLYQQLPTAKQAELAELAAELNVPPYLVNPYEDFYPGPQVASLLEHPDHSREQFENYLDNLPDSTFLISLLAAHQNLSDPIDVANIYDEEVERFQARYKRNITSRHDKCALLYEALDESSQARFERKLYPWLRAQRQSGVRQNPYRIHTSLANEQDVFTTSERHPTLIAPPLANVDLSGPDEIIVPAPQSRAPKLRLTGPRPPMAKAKQAPPALPTLGDRVQPAKSFAGSPDPPPNDDGLDSENEGDGKSGPVQHPAWQGVPGKPIAKPSKKHAGMVNQERWKEWPLFDEWLDYPNEKRPPACVRLDDWNLRHVSDWEKKEVRVANWPADFDRDGNIRRLRANYGYAAKQLDPNGEWRYLVFKSYYQLKGNEVTGNDVITLVGGPEVVKGEQIPYFRLGQVAAVQSNLGPHPPKQLQHLPSQASDTPQSRQDPQAYGVSPPQLPNPKRKPSDSDIRGSYVEKRAKGIVDSDSENDEVVMQGPVRTDRADAALQATERLITDILTVDKELGARLKSERKIITKLQSMATSLSDTAANLSTMVQDLTAYHQETTQIAAKQLCSLPRQAQTYLPSSDATRIDQHTKAEGDRLYKKG